MTNESSQQISSEQAFGILSAAYAELTVETRLLRATLIQTNQKIKELMTPAQEQSDPKNLKVVE